MIRSVRGLLLLAVAFGFLAAATPSPAQVFTPYDSFATFDPAKWRGTEFQPGNNQELSRMIVKGQLQLFLLSWGSEANNTGSSGFGSTAVRHPQPNDVGGMQALVTVAQATVQGCPDNEGDDNQPSTRAEIRGAFFNDGTSAGAGDLKGDIIAGSRSGSFSSAAPGRGGSVCRSSAASIRRAQYPGSGRHIPLQFNKSWAFGEADLLRLAWDKVDQIRRHPARGEGGGPRYKSSSSPIAGLLTDNDPPVNPFKELRVQAGNPNCTDGATASAIQALFDNVAVTQTSSPAPARPPTTARRYEGEIRDEAIRQRARARAGAPPALCRCHEGRRKRGSRPWAISFLRRFRRPVARQDPVGADGDDVGSLGAP